MESTFAMCLNWIMERFLWKSVKQIITGSSTRLAEFITCFEATIQPA